tara:strand:+ start:654 stop:827 length:174 start_codon:yes stop_codon:yes gene_type:complete
MDAIILFVIPPLLGWIVYLIIELRRNEKWKNTKIFHMMLILYYNFKWNKNGENEKRK